MTSAEEVVRPYSGAWSDDELELFGAYRHLYRIVVEGRPFWVPEKNVVLRSCQYIEMKERAVRMPWRDYCWNDTNGCCDMTYREAPDRPLLVGRACRTAVVPGMEIVRLPKGGRLRR